MSTTLDVCSGASAKRAAAAVTWGTAPVAAVMVQRLDVGEATAVPSAADAWAAAPHSPDVLADNTGPMSPARFVTAHGREGHMGVKQMGGLALTGFLLPAVEAPAGDRRRIVSVTSRPSATAYVETSVIVRAGVCNVLVTHKLVRRLAAVGSPVTVASEPVDAAAPSVIYGGSRRSRSSRRDCAGRRPLTDRTQLTDGARCVVVAAAARGVAAEDHWGATDGGGNHSTQHAVGGDAEPSGGARHTAVGPCRRPYVPPPSSRCCRQDGAVGATFTPPHTRRPSANPPVAARRRPGAVAAVGRATPRARRAMGDGERGGGRGGRGGSSGGGGGGALSAAPPHPLTAAVVRRHASSWRPPLVGRAAPARPPAPCAAAAARGRRGAPAAGATRRRRPARAQPRGWQQRAAAATAQDAQS
ncbi:hypothetical protein BU14_1249s0004 [Porphyra umbilicalis]|uniref:Uncharacterized protein n=1 Tax=Porphyra umbilicalis TaxID=2786 RepID=A0A1X6NM64_PORUM|nr:hypothetical protein BU14_1249s0004 [Porphyra umbilicalis]|eukprot:OSX69714.1 hypothetical protein BU14_1249s0004 [Porphyra umbilicalis]